jgi:tetratricopeptide (TPR) repeat protein
MKKTIVLLTLLFLGISRLTAQSTDQLMRAAFLKSYEMEAAGQLAKAIESLAALKDEGYEVSLRLGWLNYQLKQYGESAAQYRKAVKLRSSSIEARLGLVQPLAAVNAWDEVLKQYDEILGIDAMNATALYRAGYIFYSRKEYAKASRYFEKLANLYPFDYDSAHMLAWTKLRLGLNAEAKALFNRALLIQPSDKSALEGLSLIK